MKKILIIFALINIITFSFAQQSWHHSIDLPNSSSPKRMSSYTLYFSLCEDGNYDIHLEPHPNYDSITGSYMVYMTGVTLSMGKYEEKNNMLYLTDSYTGCKMLFQLVGSFKDSLTFPPVKVKSNVKPLQTFPFMKDLKYDSYIGCGSRAPWYEMKETTVEKIVKEFEANNTINHPLMDKLLASGAFIDGVYKFVPSFFCSGRFEAKLDKDKKYEFSFKAREYPPSSNKNELELYLIISSGTWERNGNILTLWDTNLQHKFYGLIRKDDSIEFLFFRWEEDMIFKKQ